MKGKPKNWMMVSIELKCIFFCYASYSHFGFAFILELYTAQTEQRNLHLELGKLIEELEGQKMKCLKQAKELDECK